MPEATRASTKDVDLYPNDFTLSVGEKSTALRPVSADTIAEVLAGKQEPPRVSGPHDINTSAGVSIGCASYPDPVSAMLVHVAAGLAAGLVLSILFDSIAAKWVDPMEALRYE